MLAAACALHQINLLSVQNSLQVIGKLQGHSDIINTCVFTTEERKMLISVSQDRTLRIWDMRTKSQKKKPSISSIAIAVDINKVETHFATGHKNGQIKLWSISDFKEACKPV